MTLKVTVALNFYVSGSFQRSTGNMCGVSQAAAHHCIKEVTNALFKRAGDYVHYWTDPDCHAEGSSDSGPSLDLPGCKEAATMPTYFNSPRCYSFSGPLLAVKDGFIFIHSWDVGIYCPFLIALEKVVGYSLKTWLLMPVRKPHNAAEERYNSCHGSTWAMIKQATGLLKMRFRCLDQSGGALQYAPVRVSRTVVVCCALQNLALQRGKALHDENLTEQHSSTDEEDAEEGDDAQQNHVLRPMGGPIEMRAVPTSAFH
ncbi:putative nuclease HARBI1 [Heterodontus francisci]|uniref:putative nuclease HARBI1 n=1 Tax=Heterodontus francisci TaxID=7792 RepID=UPI00355AE971